MNMMIELDSIRISEKEKLYMGLRLRETHSVNLEDVSSKLGFRTHEAHSQIG